MSSTADIIEQAILQEIMENAEAIVQRKDLAARLNCAPSHVSYVLETRFTPRQGYIVDSHRGYRGYVRIIKNELSDVPNVYDMLRMLHDRRRITNREFRLLDFALQNMDMSDVKKQRFLSTCMRVIERR